VGFLKLFDAVAEKIILDAMENGEFDNIEGKGKPIKYDDDSMVPPDLRMGYKILKNSGHLPPELEQEREIKNIKDLLAGCTDERERYRQMQKLNYMVMKANMMRKKPVYLERSQYYDKMAERVKVRPEKPHPPIANRAKSNANRPPEIPPILDPPAGQKRRFSLTAWIRAQWARVYS
jgi:hypothetical protein